MNYPDLIKWIFEFVYEHWILTFLFILVLRGLGLKINQSNFIKKCSAKSLPLRQLTEDWNVESYSERRMILISFLSDRN